MTLTAFPTMAYLVAGILFILSLGGLSNQETARRGNIFGIVGMALAVVAVFVNIDQAANLNLERAAPYLGGAILLGFLIGAALAARVAMTAMPQLVAMLHSFVGLAAVLVGLSSYLKPAMDGGSYTVHLIEIWLGVAIGAITFTGSIIAWAKLRGSMSGKPLLLPGRHLLNLVILISIVGLCIPFIQESNELHVSGLVVDEAVLAGPAFKMLLVMTLLACFLGVHLVVAIGGADMPVVVSMLNSYSGWAAAAAGFMLSNDLLIITGALVGSSGAILSTIMCRAMNRSIWHVIFGGFGSDGGKPAASGNVPQGSVQETNVDQVVDWARSAKEVMIVPGYGMAVARAQHLVNDLTKLLKEANVNVRYAIHPVAGRLPGHMNVLLAEAGVPYDIVLEMDEINEDCPKTDLVLVIGANDIVNPGAETDESSPIYGMPVIQVWKSTQVVVFKRGMGAGFAGVQNPLFFEENTSMLFGDARDSVQGIVSAFRES